MNLASPKPEAKTETLNPGRAFNSLLTGNGPFLHELQFMKQDIISKLNGILGGTKVAQIRYFIGEVEAPPAKHAGPEIQLDTRDLKAEEKDYIRDTLAGVADRDLRDILQKAMTGSILRRRKDP